MNCAHFDIYGFRVRIECAVASVLSGLEDDFAFFKSSASPEQALISLQELKPDYSPWLRAQASFYTPRNVAYRCDGKIIVDYSGRGIGIHDPVTGSFHLSSLDHDLLYEAAYLFLLSQSGETLDRNGLHRVHALGVSIGGRAALVLLPMGGGKSTLISALLRYPDVEILSDDSPLIDRNGDIHAFPLRIGLLPGTETSIPPDQMRTIQRMEFGPKLVVNYKYFSDRVRASAQPALIFIGERSLDCECSLRSASWLAARKALVVNCVIGLGLFQGMEFVLSRSWPELAEKFTLVWFRARACHRLLRRSSVYHLRLGRNIDRNALAVVAALREDAETR